MRCAAHQRKRLERLCRYITRPAIADDRVRCNEAGQVVLTLKTPWRDGTMHLAMSPLEFMQQLAALVPGPRQGRRALAEVIEKLLTHLGHRRNHRLKNLASVDPHPIVLNQHLQVLVQMQNDVDKQGEIFHADTGVGSVQWR